MFHNLTTSTKRNIRMCFLRILFTVSYASLFVVFINMKHLFVNDRQQFKAVKISPVDTELLMSGSLLAEVL